ncbi:uncharacterized protein LOC110738175 [Chenopodium quinoa]|uniref:uncharacterized protein LOC110738175 n=1 Tax=Chenopodium quinoa TaxID=63459 RepID=UPI000B78A570|nr:uncharacterized protein LOC110738175 [Chenopodium quinoa]
MIVNRVFAYKVKYAAHKLLHGYMHDHYQKVGGYLAAVQKSSPGSHIQLVTVESKLPTPVFQRLFMCFEGLAKGWKEGCRKVLAVDGCFLKTFLGGQLLCAVGRDANDQMYPVAWAVTEGENNLSWEWFFTHIQTFLDLGEGDEVAIISDEHQEILNAVSNVLPKAEHRHCARHIYAHWNKTYRGDEFKLQFWKIAKSYSMADYDQALSELAEISTDAAEAFKKYNPPSFCRAFMKTSMKTDAITSNIAETFNGYIILARTKHLLYMLEEIRIGLMQMLVKKRQEMTKCTTALCPRIQNKLNKEKDKAAYCNVYPSSETLFNVSHNMDQLVVNLEDRRCSCRKWDMLGIPYCHACACIFFLNQEVEDFVDPCYTRENYLKAYAGSIPPIEGERYWPKVSCPLAPPPIKIGPGRSRKNRIKDPFENPKKPGSLSKNGIQMSCSAQVSDVVNAPAHHDISAQPTQLGRGGRTILRGRGARGGQQPQTGRSLPPSSASGAGMSQSAGPSDITQVGTQASSTGRAQGRGAGRGRRGAGRGQTTRGKGAPRGVGVLFGDDGSVLTNVRGKSSREVAGTTTTMRSRKAMSQQPTNYIGGLSSSQQSNQPHQTQ